MGCECGTEKCSGCIQPDLPLPIETPGWVVVIENHFDPAAPDGIRTEEWGGLLSGVQGLLPGQLKQETLASIYILIRRKE